MNRFLQATLAASAFAAAGQAAAQVTFYEGEGFRGRAFTTSKEVGDFGRRGFNDPASSVVVDNGRWEVCEAPRFDGRCVLLRPGSYDSLRALGLQNRVSSARPGGKRRHGAKETPTPMPTANYLWRRRANERVYEAQVILVRAVMGAPTARCWTERQMVQDHRGRSSGGATAGTLLGGILGHQVAGAAAGGHKGAYASSRGLRRCQTVGGGNPAYWDVTYSYEGIEHQVQMSEPPGRTVAVNRLGEPRQ